MVVALRVEGSVARVGRKEDPRDRVVVLLRDRIELVVVAARARHREPEHALRGRIKLLVGEIHLELRLSARIVALGADREVAGGDRALGALGVVLRRKQIARELLGEKAIERLVAVERRDHVVAVAPRVRVEDVRLLAAGFRVARDVEPVAAPALAELRACEQAVDDMRECVLRRVGLERADLRLARRKPSEIEARATDQRAAVGGSSGGEVLLGELREEQRVDRVVRPVGVRDLRDIGPRDRAIRPVRRLAFGDVLVAPAMRGARGSLLVVGLLGAFLARIGRAHRDPLLERADLGGGQLAVRRHLQVDIVVANRADQQARVEVVRHHRGTALPAAADRIARVDAQAALGKARVLRVAAVALADEHRADLLLEELDLLGRRRAGFDRGDHRGVADGVGLHGFRRHGFRLHRRLAGVRARVRSIRDGDRQRATGQRKAKQTQTPRTCGSVHMHGSTVGADGKRG